MSIWELTNVMVGLVLPPGVLMLLALVGLSLMRAAPVIALNLAFQCSFHGGRKGQPPGFAQAAEDERFRSEKRVPPGPGE